MIELGHTGIASSYINQIKQSGLPGTHLNLTVDVTMCGSMYHLGRIELAITGMIEKSRRVGVVFGSDTQRLMDAPGMYHSDLVLFSVQLAVWIGGFECTAFIDVTGGVWLMG